MAVCFPGVCFICVFVFNTSWVNHEPVLMQGWCELFTVTLSGSSKHPMQGVCGEVAHATVVKSNSGSTLRSSQSPCSIMEKEEADVSKWLKGIPQTVLRGDRRFSRNSCSTCLGLGIVTLSACLSTMCAFPLTE